MRHFTDVNDFLWVLPRGEIKNDVAFFFVETNRYADGACTMQIDRLVLSAR